MHNFEEEYLKSYQALNEEQRKAVDMIHGPVMVIAGPGTGKTQLLSTRIGRILHEDAYPSNILCLTYTNAGVQAMQERLLKLIGIDARDILVATFHSFADQVLSRYSNPRDGEYQMIDDLAKRKIIRKLIEEEVAFGTPLKDKITHVMEAIKVVTSCFDQIRQEKWSPDQLIAEYKQELESVKASDKYRYVKGENKGELKLSEWSKYENRILRYIQAVELYPKYEAILINEKYRDFTSSIDDAIQLIRTNDEIRASLQEQYQFIMIDEYQDTNGAQLELAASLLQGSEMPNVMIVGDEDQAIYRFQGASIKNIGNFFDAYLSILPFEEQKERIIILNKNYRSSPKIIESSKYLMSHGTERAADLIPNHQLEKDFKASHPTYASVQYPVISMLTEKKSDLYIPVARQIEEWIKEGVRPSEIAVLFPTNPDAMRCSEHLQLLDIPYRLSSKLNLLDDAMIIQLIQYLRILYQFVEEHKFSQSSVNDFLMAIWNQISLYDLSAFWAQYHERRKANSEISIYQFLENYDQSTGIQKAFQNFQKCVRNWNFLPMDRLFHFILDTNQIKEWAMQQPNRLDQIQKIEFLSQYISEQRTQRGIRTWGEILALIQEFINEELPIHFERTINLKESVYLSTYHSSKGMEFEHVIVVYTGRYRTHTEKFNSPKKGEALDLFISTKKGKKNEVNTEYDPELEERRRLLYVAMTRAKQNLVLADYTQKSSSNEKLNPYTAELPITSEEVILATPDIDVLVKAKKYNISEDDYLKFQFTNRTELEYQIDRYFENAYVSERIDHFSYSHTSIQVYLECPLKFYAEKIIKIPQESSSFLQIGDLYHRVLEDYFLESKEKSELQSLDQLIRIAKLKLTEYRETLTEVEYIDTLKSLEYNLKMLYDQYLIFIQNLEYLIEEKFETNYHGISINGKIDKLDLYPNQLILTDYKTGGYQKAAKKLKSNTEQSRIAIDNNTHEAQYGGDYWRQAYIYFILLKDQYPERALQAFEYVFIFPEEGVINKYRITYTQEGEDFVNTLIKSVYDNVNARNFEGCKQPECRWCQVAAS